MTENVTEINEIASQEETNVTTPETTETPTNEPIIEEIEPTPNPWDNAPEGVVFYREIKDNGEIIGLTVGAELAYKIGLSLDNYLSFDEVQQSDKDFNYYLKAQCPMKSETDLQKDAYREEIQTLKKQLSATDYKAIKYAEGVLTDEEYQETGIQRQVWRARINELEELINE